MGGLSCMKGWQHDEYEMGKLNLIKLLTCQCMHPNDDDIYSQISPDYEIENENETFILL